MVIESTLFYSTLSWACAACEPIDESYLSHIFNHHLVRTLSLNSCTMVLESRLSLFSQWKLLLLCVREKQWEIYRILGKAEKKKTLKREKKVKFEEGLKNSLN